MRTWLRGKISLLFVVCAALLAIPVVALADDVSNNLDPSVDAVAEDMPLTVGGANGTTQLYIVERNGDGKNGCNLTGSTTASFSVSSSNTAVATVSPSSVTFDSCGATRTLTVTPQSAGTANITLTQTSNTTDGSFNVNPATFKVTVTNPTPANTAPTVTVGGVTGGASYNKGSVPTATCNVVDAEDGNSSFDAALSEITGPYASDGIGEQTASCSYTDGGGLTVAASETYGIVDPSAPVITKVVTPASPDGDNNWYTSNVTVVWTVSDPASPNSIVKTGCVDQNITTDQDATTYSCSATSAGGSASEQSVTIKRDATDPTISGSKSPDPTSFGWNNTDVAVNFTCGDNLSGVPAAACGPDQTLTGEGAGQSAEGTATDNAGNTASATVSDINIDKTNPLVSLVGGPANGSSHYFGFVPPAPGCTASDALSGLDGACSVSGYDATVGHHTVTASANDKAANTNSDSHSYDVLGWDFRGFYQPVDMGGVHNTIKGGQTVPIKFELFAGSTELTDTADVLQPLKYQKISCTTGVPAEDAIETVATGGTSLRYDTTGGQFIYNWKTPTGTGTCYSVTISSIDGSSKTALFKLK
jgi:hypothetical protein